MVTRTMFDAAAPAGRGAEGSEQHLLFNALNAISALMLTQGPGVADDALADFGRVLRATLRGKRSQTFSEEVEDARAYLRIAELRFPDRVRHSIGALGEPAVNAPPLQPFLDLVEQLVDQPGRETINVGLALRQRSAGPVLALTLDCACACAIHGEFAAVIATIAASVPNAHPARYRCALEGERLMGVIRLERTGSEAR